MAKMTEGSRKVLETLKAHYAEGKKWQTAELAEAAGVTSPAVTGSVTGMCKKGLAMREVAVVPAKDKNGNDIEKEIKLISLTEAGYSFDPDAVVEAE